MKTKAKGCCCEMKGKEKGMGGAYGKMEKMLGKKDVEKKGMKEGSKADMKKDIGMMMKTMKGGKKK
jgi:hypothetical protein